MLINRFLRCFNEEKQAGYEVTAWPDDDSSMQNVDALARDPLRGTCAIEHTILQPFIGEKDDSTILLKGIGKLDKKPSMTVPGYDVTLTVGVGAVPKGVHWPSVADRVERWYVSAFPTLRMGRTKAVVPDLEFTLELDVEKELGEGHFFITRWMPDESIDAVVTTALAAKLPKLTAYAADLRLLLLEKDSLPRSPDEIGAAIDRNAAAFPALQKLDEAWVINTVAWRSEDYAPCYFVWPRPSALAWRRLRNLTRRRLRSRSVPG